MNNVNKLLREGQFEVADNGFSTRVMAAVEERQVHVPLFVPRRISVWGAYRWPVIGAAVGMVFLCLLMSRVVDLNQMGSAWGARSEMLAQRLAYSPNFTLLQADTAPAVMETEE